jgi:3-dehydroquinate synthase
MYYYNTKGFEKLISYIEESNPTKIIVITDTNTYKYCLPVLANHLSTFYSIVIPEGDKTKNIDTLQFIWKELINIDADRNSLILNLGGGVVTDIGGFAASTYKRGMKFIHIPTSLLGMVDASIGGKNGINFMGAKNQIGTINPPEFVIINEIFLQTLPNIQLLSGFAEMLKHGLIIDKDYWNQLIKIDINTKIPDLQMIKKSIDIKNNIIKLDPYEKGLRKILNFGHTLGHAIESYAYYSKNYSITHGHAVAIGMILVAHISNNLLDFEYTNVNLIKKEVLKKYRMIKFNSHAIRKIIDYLKFDKKNTNGMVNYVLIDAIGSTRLDIQVPNQLVLEAFAYYME